MPDVAAAPKQIAFWPAENAPAGELEATFKAWSTVLVYTELCQNLAGHKPVVREGLCGRLLAAKLASLSDRRAQLEGLASRPELNGIEVTLLGEVSAADGRVPVRVRSDGSEIRVYMAKLMPPRQSSKTEKWLRGQQASDRQQKKKLKEQKAAVAGRQTTELSAELARRREALLDRAESLTLEAQHLTDHMNFINAQAEKLQGVAVQIKKRFAITQGLYKSTKDADKIIQLQQKEEAIRGQEAAYNANVEWLRAEQAWLDEQPAMLKMMAKMRESMVQGADGRWIEKPPDLEAEEEMSFEDLLAQMKMEDEARAADGGAAVSLT